MPSAARAKQDAQAIHQRVAATGNSNAGNPFTAGIKPPVAKTSAAASSNLAKAMQMQAQEEAMGLGVQATATEAGGSEYPEVDEFLASINLQKYKDRFLENGIEDQETILELNDQHLDAVGIPLGYKLKILKRIKTLR